MRPRQQTFCAGQRVVATVGEPRRSGRIVRRWHPWHEYQVLWDDGTLTSVWWNQITAEPQEQKAVAS